jgi:hypothetical protein
LTGDKIIPIAGVAIGDGWTDPYNQLTKNAEFLYSVGVVDDKTRDVVAAFEKKGRSDIWWSDYLQARDAFDGVTNTGVAAGGNINVYNYR